MKTVEIAYRYGREAGLRRPRPADADAARRRLDDGNRAFSELLDGIVCGRGVARRTVEVDPGDLGFAAGGRAAPEQQPYAAILGCADARVPVELVFNEGPNDLFVVRVAGNVLGAEVLGSLGYAIEHLGGSLKVVAVLGHSGCGAVSAAVDVFLAPSKYLDLAANHALRGVLDRILVVVQATAMRLAEFLGPGVVERPGYREALVEGAVAANAALSAFTLRHEIARARKRSIRALYGVYLLDEHRVWAPRAGGREWGLADPPADRGAFHALGGAIMRSPRIKALLQ
jgi:carbonic anhydrase